MHTRVYLLRVHMTNNKYMYKIHIFKSKYTPGLSNLVYIYTGCIFTHVQTNFYILVYAIAFTCPKLHSGANYTYMYNLHTVCKSARVNGALVKCDHLSVTWLLQWRWIGSPQFPLGSRGGRVFKLLACGARGLGFNSRSRHLNFISCFQVAIWLKYL